MKDLEAKLEQDKKVSFLSINLIVVSSNHDQIYIYFDSELV